MAEQVTKVEVKNIINTAITKAVDDLSEVINGLAQSIHVEVVDLKKDNADIKNSIDRLVNTVDGFVKRLDEIETEQLRVIDSLNA
jgi:hypothetical protein